MDPKQPDSDDNNAWDEIRKSHQQPHNDDDVAWVDELPEASPTTPGYTTAVFVKAS